MDIEQRDGGFVLRAGEQEIPLSRDDLHNLIAAANNALRDSIVMVPRLKLG